MSSPYMGSTTGGSIAGEMVACPFCSGETVTIYHAPGACCRGADSDVTCTKCGDVHRCMPATPRQPEVRWR